MKIRSPQDEVITISFDKTTLNYRTDFTDNYFSQVRSSASTAPVAGLSIKLLISQYTTSLCQSEKQFRL